MITDKRVLSPEEKESLILKWEQSGLSQLEFCIQEGISRKLFSRWKCKREAKINTESAGEFINIQSCTESEAERSIKLKLPNGIELIINY